MRELAGHDIYEQGLPPGFRFHPTDEELITFYLASKVFNGSFCGVEIAEVDLNRCEPWELPGIYTIYIYMSISYQEKKDPIFTHSFFLGSDDANTIMVFSSW